MDPFISTSGGHAVATAGVTRAGPIVSMEIFVVPVAVLT